MESITGSPEWLRLRELRGTWRGRRLVEVQESDPDRADRYLFEAAGIQLDISRHRVDDEIIDALIELLRNCRLPEATEALWRGDKVNHTENRAALHVAHRARDTDGVADKSALARIAEQRTRMLDLADAIREGRFASPSGEPFSDIVHIGIGGSHLGPELVLQALDNHEGDAPTVHFLSTTDPLTLKRLLSRLDAGRTLVVVVSKSFATAEAMLNAATLRDWLASERGADDVLETQFVGVSANADAMTDFGIPARHQLHFDDSLGGRYSVWSAVGLPIAICCGRECFEDFLEGARAMDRHFRSAGPRENLPMLLALIGIWNINFFDANTHAVLPYSNALDMLPDYLQQLEMESNGKQVDRDGQRVDYRTAPVVWGNVGMNAQHSFFQQLHQGTGWVPLDVIAVAEAEDEFPEHREAVLSNALAQMEALNRGRTENDILPDAEGRGEQELLPFKVFPGNRPSSLIMLDRLDAARMGALLALYEHKVFVQSVVWNLNPFDQFGVEFGKELAGELDIALSGEALRGEHDAVARRWVERLKRRK